MGKIKLFLDSGAYSALTQGVKIDIQEYIDFIKKYKDHLEAYANLDVIGDAEASYKNQKIMEEAGLTPIPCFHYGEPIGYLKEYIENYDYISLGGMVPISTGDLRVWLDELFSKYICDEKGMPRVKVHGFGLTSHPLLIQYPWYSVDSTSWVVTGRMGAVMVPIRRNGQWDYLQPPWKVDVSFRSPTKDQVGKHITTFSPMEKSVIEKYFREKGYVLGNSKFRTVDADYELDEDEIFISKAVDGKREMEILRTRGLGNDYKLRDELNIIYYLDLQNALPEWPWAFKSRTDRGLGI